MSEKKENQSMSDVSEQTYFCHRCGKNILSDREKEIIIKYRRRKFFMSKRKKMKLSCWDEIEKKLYEKKVDLSNDDKQKDFCYCEKNILVLSDWEKDIIIKHREIEKVMNESINKLQLGEKEMRESKKKLELNQRELCDSLMVNNIFSKYFKECTINYKNNEKKVSDNKLQLKVDISDDDNTDSDSDEIVMNDDSDIDICYCREIIIEDLVNSEKKYHNKDIILIDNDKRKVITDYKKEFVIDKNEHNQELLTLLKDYDYLSKFIEEQKIKLNEVCVSLSKHIYQDNIDFYLVKNGFKVDENRMNIINNKIQKNMVKYKLRISDGYILICFCYCRKWNGYSDRCICGSRRVAWYGIHDDNGLIKDIFPESY